VASGLPRPAGATLWTRLDGAEGPGRIAYEVATDPGFRHVVRHGRLPATPENDFTAQVRIAGRPLRPAQEYFFRFETVGEHSPIGRFRTLPPRDSRTPVRIAFWTCQDYRVGHYAPHRAMAAEDLDLVVCLGDYIYEDRSSLTRTNIPGREDTTGANHDGVAITLDDYRAKYRLYRSDAALRALHAAHAMCFLGDDHEVVNDYWREGGGGVVTPGFAQRRAAAYRAWFEHIPAVRIGGAQSTRIYRSLRVGALADLFFIDDRQYRDVQPCQDTPLLPCDETRAPGRTMLGPAQKAWLKAAMRGSDAPWKVLVNGLMMMGLDQPLPGAPKFTDTWDGYEAEREELVSFWRSNGIEDVVVMTGDDHDNYAGVVTTTGGADGLPGAVEFVVPSVTSDNTAELLGGLEAEGAVGEVNARALNPHLVLVDQRHHGYCVLELDPQEARVLFRHVASRTDPLSQTTTRYRLRVARGTTRVEPI
jgi:alkaline phosphatase D